MTELLVLYYSAGGHTRNLANSIALGIEKAGCVATIRTVQSLRNDDMDKNNTSDPLVSKEDLQRCHGLALGSPTRFGQMATPLKLFWESTGDDWLKGTLSGKPACVFSSSSSLHGGQEVTLLSMMVPLLHHGMLLMGVPYSEPDLHTTTSGGTPYGVTHVENNGVSGKQLSEEEKRLGIALGTRLANTALKLN